MSVKSSASFGDTSSNVVGGGNGEVVRFGYLKKLKTMRKKYFVLRAENADSSSRLEYYDNEKKYRTGLQPKRCISLTACFNINRRVDTKHKHVIALYTKDDCFCVVLDTEKDLDEWLKALLSLQRGEDVVDGEPPKPTFEHVWQVTMLNKGLGNSRNIIGPYHLCFTDKTLSLVRKSTTGLGAIVNSGHHTDQVEFSLMSIRRCGHSECFFYMEVGRSAITGAGELWMQTEDTNIAQNMGDIILRAMSNNNNKEDLGPKPRIRSSSANEASKPILMQRRQTHCGQKSTSYCSPSQDGVSSSKNVDPPETTTSSTLSTVGYSNISTPFSSTQHPSPSTTVNQAHLHQRSSGAVRPSQRRHSVSAGGPVSWSGMAHHQRTQSLPLAPHVPHIENNNPCYLPRTSSKRLNNNSSSSIRCMGGRERCDSMPTRARTSSEGTAPHPIRTSHLAPHRPQSFYGRDISHSPPAGSPVSPASAACSTDSAGSSLSIDEPDAWPDYADTPLSRYGHSLTPDEPIVEEETSDSPYVQLSPTNGSPLTGGYVPMAPLSSDDGYVDMSPGGHNADMSPAASSCSITSGTPSTDMRFSEYHLEKVTSYFTPSEEDDTSSAERPHRAYSVGSRPDVLKLRTKLDAGNHENARVRAFSVGSRSKGVHNRVLPPHGHPPSTGGKSSSAPLLSGSHSHLGSHNSMERMDDLMEMDFSKPSSNTQGYVAMSPKNRIVPPGYVEMKPGYTEATTPDLPYMDMRPSASPIRPSSITTHTSSITNHSSSMNHNSSITTHPSSITSHPSSMTHLEPKDSYMDMRPVSSPLKPSSTTSKDYMDMKPSTSPHKPKHANPYYVEMTGKLGTSPKNNNKTSSPIQEEYMDMDFRHRSNNRTISQPVDLPPPKKPADGYMEMLWGGIQRKSSLDSAKTNDDYMNMTAPGPSSKKKDRRGSGKKEKNRSQPITIQTPAAANSPSPVNSFATFLQNTTRKNSTGTPPKHPPNYLPLSSYYSPTSSPYASLRRQRRKSTRRDSKDTTPTSETSTIFPFSPGSPIKPFHPSSTRKCAVDASSGTVKIADATDYVNFSPATAGDYALMRPTTSLTEQLSNISITPPCLFKPIEEDTRLGAVSPRPGDTAPHLRNEHEPSSTADYELLKSRPDSVASELGSSSSTLIGGSRPSSVNADLIPRPSSVTSERELHYASLDLAPMEEDATRSPHMRGQEAASSPTFGNVEGGAPAPAFTYAEIDFIKSLKNNKIKH